MRKQVVLLFDLHCLGWDAPSDAAFEARLHCLRRATLRLLLSQANCLEKDGGLRLGFRLFDSARYKPGTDRSGFVDFTLDAFETLENSLANALERRRTSSPRRPSDTGAAPAGQALTRALHEVLSDFQWERADVESPVKRPRRRRGAAPAADDSGNAVYLVTALPSAAEAGRRFAGGAAPADLPARLTAAVLSHSFRRVFCDQCRVRLHVLDTAGLQPTAVSESCVGRAFSALAEATGGALTRLETLLELPGPEPAAELTEVEEPPTSEAAQDGDGAAVEGGAGCSTRRTRASGSTGGTRRVRWLMGAAEQDVSLTVCSESAVSSSDQPLLRLLSSESGDGRLHVEVVAKMTDSAGDASHVQLATVEARQDTFSADTLLLVRLSGRPCLLQAVSARRCTLLGLGPPPPPPSDGGAAPRPAAEAVRCRLRSERPLVADMLQPWFVGPPPEEPREQRDVWPTPTEQWPKGLNELLARSLRHRRARGDRTTPSTATSAGLPAAVGAAPVAGAGAAGGLQRGRQMMARAAQMTAVRQRRGQRQQAAEQQRQTWRRQEKERRMRDQQQRALRDVSGVTDTEELVNRLLTMKERCVAGQDQDMAAVVQSVINTLLLHIKTMDGVDTASCLRQMLKDRFLPEKRQVMERYRDDRGRRVREYQYQIILLLESCWVLGGEVCEDDKDQLVDLLRMISMHGSPTAMTEFMELTMVESYQHTQPDLLLELYEELSRPPPAALLQQVSPSRAPPDTCRPPDSVGSVSSLLSGSGPGSQAVLLSRAASLTRQPSLLDASRKRQIMVPKPKDQLSRHHSHSSGSSRSMILASAAAARAAAAAAGTAASTASCAGPAATSAASSGPSRRPASGTKTGEKRSLSTGRVKRNLFESLGRSPRRSQTTLSRTAGSPQRRSLNSSFVPETPAQKSRTRRRTDSGAAAVVRESPDAKDAVGDDGLTPRRAAQRLTLTRRASFYNAEDGSRHFARARRTVLAERLQQSAPAPAAASRLPTDPRESQPLIARLFGERGRVDSGDSVSSLAWGLDSMSPSASASASVADVGDSTDRRSGEGDGDGDGDGNGDRAGRVPDTPSRDRAGRVPDTPSRRVQFDLTPAKGAGRAPARGMTPRSILKATPSCLASPDLFGTPQKTTPRVLARRKRLFSATPSKAEGATPPPPPPGGSARGDPVSTPPRSSAPTGSGVLFTPPPMRDRAEDLVTAGSRTERTPDKTPPREAGTPPQRPPHGALLGTPLKAVTVVLTPLKSPHLLLGSPRRAVPLTPSRSSPRRPAAGAPCRAEAPLTPGKSPARFRPDLGTPSRRLLSLPPSVAPPPESVPEEEAPPPAVAGEGAVSVQGSPLVSRRRSRSRSGSAPREQEEEWHRDQTTPPRTSPRTPPKTPPRTPSQSPRRNSPRRPAHSSPQTPPTRSQTPPRTPPRTPPKTPPRQNEASPHKSPVMRPNLQYGEELELRSPAKEPPTDRGRSPSPEIGPAGDGLPAAMLARFGPVLVATSTPAAVPPAVPTALEEVEMVSNEDILAAMSAEMPQFSPLGTTASSVNGSPSKIDIGEILNLLNEPSDPATATMSTVEFVSTMESYLEAAEMNPEPLVQSVVEPPVMSEAIVNTVAAPAPVPVAAVQPYVRPCSVLLSPLLMPPAAGRRSGQRRSSEPPSPARQLRSQTLRHSLSEVLTDRPSPLTGERGGCDPQTSEGATQETGESELLDNDGEAALTGRPDPDGRLLIGVPTGQTGYSESGSGNTSLATSTEGSRASVPGGGARGSPSLTSYLPDDLWDSGTSSGAGRTRRRSGESESDLADVSAQSSAKTRRCRPLGTSGHRPASSDAEDGATEDEEQLDSDPQSSSVSVSARSVPDAATRPGGTAGEELAVGGGGGSASVGVNAPVPSSPARSNRRGKRTRSEVSSSGPQTEDDSLLQTDGWEESERVNLPLGTKQLRSSRALVGSSEVDTGMAGSDSERYQDDGAAPNNDDGLRSVRASVGVSAEAKTYSQRQTGRKKKRSRLESAQSALDKTGSAPLEYVDEEARRKESELARRVDDPEEASRGTSAAGQRIAPPVLGNPLRRNGSLNVTPSKRPSDTWQVTGITRGEHLSPNSKRTSPSIRMKLKLTSATSSPARHSPCRLKCFESPDSVPEGSSVPAAAAQVEKSSSEGCPPPPMIHDNRPSQIRLADVEFSPEIPQPSTSKSRSRVRSRKTRSSIATDSGAERSFFSDDTADSSVAETADESQYRTRHSRGGRAVCGRDWYLSGDELDSTSESELHDVDDSGTSAPAASRRRGRPNKSRPKKAGGDGRAESEAGSGAAALSEGTDSRRERRRRKRAGADRMGHTAADLAARLEQVRRQTLQDLRFPGSDDSPASVLDYSGRRTAGTPEPEPEPEPAPPLQNGPDARDVVTPAREGTKVPKRSLARESEPLTPSSRKRKRLLIYDTEEGSDDPPLELRIELERHDSQTRKRLKEEPSEAFPDGLKIKKRAKQETTSGQQTMKEESDALLEDEEDDKLQSEKRGSISSEKMGSMKENNPVIREDNGERRKKKKKSKRPRPELVVSAAGDEGDRGDTDPQLSPALTPSTRGRKKEVSYAELSEDDDAVFQLIGEEQTQAVRGKRSRSSKKRRRDGRAADPSVVASDDRALPPSVSPLREDLAAPAQLPTKRPPPPPPPPLSLHFRTPPRQRFTRTRIQDIGLPLEDINALAVSPLTPSTGKAVPGASSQKVFTPPSALSLLQLTTSPIVAPVQPTKRVRRALHQ